MRTGSARRSAPRATEIRITQVSGSGKPSTRFFSAEGERQLADVFLPGKRPMSRPHPRPGPPQPCTDLSTAALGVSV